MKWILFALATGTLSAQCVWISSGGVKECRGILPADLVPWASMPVIPPATVLSSLTVNGPATFNGNEFHNTPGVVTYVGLGVHVTNTLQVDTAVTGAAFSGFSGGTQIRQADDQYLVPAGCPVPIPTGQVTCPPNLENSFELSQVPITGTVQVYWNGIKLSRSQYSLTPDQTNAEMLWVNTSLGAVGDSFEAVYNYP